MSPQPNESQPGDRAFADEVSRVRQSGALGENGRLRELFDYLADLGTARSATQADIAERVFGQVDSDGDDATVRVYVHRLRKRLDHYYADGQTELSEGRLVIPTGIYAVRLQANSDGEKQTTSRRMMMQTWLILAGLLLATAAAFFAGRSLGADDGNHPPINAIWRPFIDSDRPIMVVVGDYYMFGEIDPFNPADGRLIRDFSVNSPADLVRAQGQNPERYGTAEDVGLTYLPLSAADALRALMPVLARDDKPVRLIPASQLTSKTLSDYNVVYVGLLSGMGLLEDVNFMSSNLAVGESYDELIHIPTGGHFVSSEAQMLPLPGYYTDYGYLSVFREPGGGLVAVVAGERDTALRAIAPLVTAKDPPEALVQQARTGSAPSYEALFEITGQQGAEFGERLVLAASRPRNERR